MPEQTKIPRSQIPFGTVSFKLPDGRNVEAQVILSREWFRWFENQYEVTGGGNNALDLTTVALASQVPFEAPRPALDAQPPSVQLTPAPDTEPPLVDYACPILPLIPAPS